MRSKKVCIPLTARGNYAKMKSVISAINQRDDLELCLIAGGSLVLDRYGKILEDKVVSELKIDQVIHFLVEGENPLTMAKSAGLAAIDFASAFQNLQPDIVVVIADRYESLAIAMVAAYMNIPIAHIEGGEVSGSVDETVRHAVTKLAHLHLPATEAAGERIIKMGETEESVFVVGATSLDVLTEINLTDLQPVHEYQVGHGVGPVVDLTPNEYLIVAYHPVTTEYTQNYRHVMDLGSAIKVLGLPTVWLWPNMDAGSDGVSKGIRVLREEENLPAVHFLKSLPMELFGPLLANAACIAGNSSSGIREASFLGTPAVNIGTRQANRERGGNVIDVDYNEDEIVAAVRAQVNHGRVSPSYVYGSGRSGERVASIFSQYKFPQQKQNTF